MKSNKDLKTKTIETELGKRYKTFWSLFGNPSNDYLRIYAGINNQYDYRYVPEHYYYSEIEPTLNNKAYALAYSDKNIYERFLPKFSSYFPKTILRGINGVIYDHNYSRVEITPQLIKNIIEIPSDYILKPAVETSGGSNVLFISKESQLENGINAVQKLIDSLTLYKGNFVLQEKITSHNWLKEFNETSLNTVRLFVYRSIKNNEIVPVSSVLRFGREGSIVDNQAAGGLSCGISAKGILSSFAIDKMGRKYTDIPAIFKYQNSEVPNFNEMVTLVKEIGTYYNYQRLLGFDVTVDDNNNIRILEINCKNIETNFLQMNNGPLFGEYTDEIIEYVTKSPKSVVFDFYI